jgi:SpoVK/Ycf46/Vps4 family AAA+-type ATPase
MRRLAGHVRFWPPELDERIALWKSMLNPDLPVADDLDVDDLATRYPEMTGANIRNAAIAGAFLAAAEGVPLAQQHLLRAARIEYVSMGRQLGGQSR